MLDDTEERTLAQFFPDLGQRTVKQVGEGIKRSYERAYTTLRQLEGRKILNSEMLGGTLVFRVRDNGSPEVYQAFFNIITARLEKFDRRNMTVMKALMKLKGEIRPQLIAVFGSYGKGTERKDSDVDILCVSEDKRRAEREVAALSREFGIRFSPVIISAFQAFGIKRENRAFFEELRDSAIVIYGRDLFFDICYGGDGNGV